MPVTRAQDLDDLTPDQLVAEANTLFVKANEENTNLGGGHERKLLYHLQAQFYLTTAARKRADEAAERDRKRNEEIAERDHKLEIWVIRLITAEIVLSVIFGGIGIYEGWKQGKVLDRQVNVLDHMDTSAAATSTSLQKLVDDQSKSLDRLQEMNDKLQGSLTTTGTMASSTGKQLKILQQQQAERAAEQAKKPKLVGRIGAVPINTPNTVIPIREQTDTTITLDFALVNDGDAKATAITLRVALFAKDASFQSSEPFHQLPEARDSPAHVYVIRIDYINPRGNIPMTLTFTFPKGQSPFQVLFNVDASEIDTGTPLGIISLNPAVLPKP